MGIRIAFIVLFILVASVPTWLMPFYANESRSENRKMTEMPDFSVNSILDFMDEWQSYYSDHFAFRDKLASGYISFKMKILEADPLPGKVRKGKDGWFYLGNNFLNVYNASIGAERVNEKEIERVVRSLAEMKRFCDSLGIGFYMIIPPNKHTIYPEYLPVTPNYDNPRKLDVLKQRLGLALPDMEIIDLRAGLSGMKDSIRVFYKTDSHWNDIGAAYGVQRLLDRVRERYPVGALLPADYTMEEKKTMRKDETGMLNIEVPESYPSLKPVPGRVPEFRDSALEGETIRTYSKGSTLRFVLFRDSFFDSMLPFFAPHAGDALYIWSPRFDKERVLEEKPDIVILEVVERQLFEIQI